MASLHVAIAEAVKDAINSASLPFDVTACREYPGSVNQQDVPGYPDVFVFPIGRTTEYLNRANNALHQFDVAVAVRARLNVTEGKYDQDQLDCLLDFCEDLEIAVRTAGAMAGRQLVSFEQDDLLDPDQLGDHMFYTSLVFRYSRGGKP